ncbi:MAG: T9SS type A sorting domain-containing protein [Bacteriovoracaceae bacterium]|nr:T9SS type A sorting domain-containing protein [Bacteroidota bacterium]
MRSVYIVMVLILLTSVGAFSQTPDEVVLPDYNASGNYLNDQIMGDTTSLGTRKNPNRTYVLQKNGMYLIAASIRNNGWTLRIKAENVPGKRPVVYAFKNSVTGVYSSQQFDVRGNFWIKNIALVGWSTIAEEISQMPPYIINVNGVGYTVEVDSCVLMGVNGVLLRVPSATHLVSATNSIFTQSGNLFNTDIGNGRPFDFRNTTIDTVIIRNCTFTDGTDRVVRHYNATGPIKEFVFDHNTVLNYLSTHGNLALGRVGRKVTITNNLFVDNFVLGRDSTDDTRLGEFGNANEKETNGKNRMTMVSSVPDSAGQVDPTVYIVRNNYYGVTPAVQAWYDSKSALGIGNLIPLTYHISKKLGADSLIAFRKDTIAFTLSPKHLVPFATWYYDPAGANKKKANTGFTADMDMQRSDWKYYVDTMKLTYPKTRPAYTGADGGQPAGSLMWWNLTLLGVNASNGQVVPNEFSLEQNYPNPFNPSTQLGYRIGREGLVSLKIYDLLGREIATLVNKVLQPGSYTAQWNASGFSSGVYFYKIEAGQFVSTKKMFLVK